MAATSPTYKRHRGKVAARIAKREQAAEFAARNPHSQVPTADAREQVAADIRNAQRGTAQASKRDTSRRHVRPTDGSGDRVTGWNVECTRNDWRGEGKRNSAPVPVHPVRVRFEDRLHR